MYDYTNTNAPWRLESAEPLFCVWPAGKGGILERALVDTDVLIEQSLRLEQTGDLAAALTACNEAVCKYPTPAFCLALPVTLLRTFVDYAPVRLSYP